METGKPFAVRAAAGAVAPVAHSPSITSPLAPFPDLTRLFAPSSLALLGATEDMGKFGGRVTKQVIDFGYRGTFYPVNPRREEIFGHACYATIEAVPEVPDHVGILLPAHAVPDALERCVARGVPFVTVFSSGFGEVGTPEGRAQERRIVEIARKGRTRVVGPNCNGLVNFVDSFAMTTTGATRGDKPLVPGDIGIVGQSGGASQVNTMWRAREAGLAVSLQMSCGNCADLDLLDYAGYMLERPEIKVVLVLAETLTDGARLRALAARAAACDKPIVMLKIGRTQAGSRAAASHTGAVTGADAVCDAALAQLGIIRVEDCNELYETAMLLRSGKRPEGWGASAISISGGNLVMIAEVGEGLGLKWPDYAEQTRTRLGQWLPDFGAVSNPTDLTAAANGDRNAFMGAASVILGDPAVDVLIPVVTIARADEIRSVAALSAASPKPVAILFTGCASDDPSVTPQSLVAAGCAVYRDATPCARAVNAAMRYGEFRRRLAAPPPARPADIDVARARALLAPATKPLSEAQSKALLQCYGVPVTREYLAHDADEAVRYARALNAPAALKIQSPDIPHKTEADAVRLGISGEDAVRKAYGEVLAAARAYKPDALLEGVVVQEMITDAHEMLVGITRDPTFGPVLTVGLGGIFVEVLKDVAFRLPPFGADTAQAALRELRAFGVLEGARGRPRADIEALSDCVARMSWLAADLEDLIEEVDANPLCVLPHGRGVRLVDALVIPRGLRS